MSEQSIFLAALDISDPAERAAYVEAACGGNAALRTEIEALLAAHERPGPFLDEPAVAQMSDSGAAETRSVAAGGDSGFAPTRSPDTAGGTTEDVLAFLQPPTRAGSLGRLAYYEVQEVLGRGGFGTVLRAFDERLHRVVAIKVMAPQLAASGAARARFLREGRSAAAVHDAHVINVYHVSGDDEPMPYLVMEFVAGQTLQQKIDKVGPLAVAEVLRIGSQIAHGLAAAHAQGLIHRDIKPANILLENGVERVKITDFGLARAADDASISQSGVVAGTPQYMAPEQARGEAIDHRADLFSLGSVLYAMCTGRPPFRADTTLAVLKRVCEDEPRPVREVNPAVPTWLADVVAKLHAKKPDDRFQTAKEVADLLAQYLTELQMQGSVTPQFAVPPVAPAPPARGTREWPVLLLWVVFPLLAGVLAFFLPDEQWPRLALGLLAFWILAFVIQPLIQILPHPTPAAWRVARSDLARPRRKWKWAAAALVLASLALAAVRFGPAVVRYSDNLGAVEFASDPDVLGYDILPGVRDDVAAPQPIEGGPHPTLQLSPGAYRIEVKCAPGRAVERWEVTTHGLFTSRTQERGGTNLLLAVGRGERLTVRPVLRDAAPAPPSPAVSPAVPKKAAEVAAFLVGSWKSDTEVLEPKLPPEAARSTGVTTNELLTAGKFLRSHGSYAGGRVEALLVQQHDAGNDTIRGWFFTSAGEFTGPSIGVWNAEKRSMLWMEKLPSGLQSVHQFDFIDGNTIKTQMYYQNAKNQIVFHVRQTLTRLPAPAVVPRMAPDPKRPDEMKALERLVGEWRDELTVRKSPVLDGPAVETVETVRVKAESILGGRFVEVIETGETKNTTDYWLAGVNGGRVTGGPLRAWSFGSNGSAKELDGVWDDANQTMIWKSTDNTIETRWAFKGDDRRELQSTTKNKNGKLLSEAAGVSRRVTSAPPVAVAPFDAAKAKQHQEVWAKHLDVPVEVANAIGMKLRLIPPGEFQMGSTAAEFELFKAEDHAAELKRQMPSHTVKLTKPYRIGATEVTVGQFRRFVKDAKYRTEAETDGTGGDVIAQGKHAWKAGIYWDNPGFAQTDDCPVTQVSWNDAVQFCNWLSRQEGLPPVYAKEVDGTWRAAPGPGYRLPTEAEWEFACRAGSRTSYFFGDDPKQIGDYAWHKGNADGHPHPVGEKRPNPFGLFDVLGNVREWVADWNDDQYTPPATVTDPPGPATGTRRVMRGGGWSSSPVAAQSAFRSHTAPKLRLCYLGFRVAVVIEPKPQPPLSDKQRFQGAWVGESGECDGQPLSKEMAARMRLTFEGGSVRVTFPEGQTEERATFKLDPDVSPKEFDVIGTDQKGRVGIYRFLDGGRLEICMGEEKERPTEFKSKPGTTRLAIVLRREPKPVLIRAFDPAKDKPVPPRGDPNKITVEAGAWRIENATNTGNFNVLLATVTDGLPEDGTLVFRAKVKVQAKDKDAWGGLMLGDASPSFHGYDWPEHYYEYRGDVPEWTQKEVRYPARLFHKKQPATVPVYVGLHADGVVWVKDAELLYLPPPVAAPAKEAPNPAAVLALKDAVAAKARVRDEAKVRFEVGKTSKIELLVAEADLSEARIKLAEEERKPAEVVAHLEALVRQRQEERDLIAVRVEVGIERPAVLDDADARLADAKARLAKVKPPAPPQVAPEPHPAARLLRKFDPATDETITRGQQDKTGWLFKPSREERTLRLYEIAKPQVDAGGVLAFRAVMRTTRVTRAYPEVVCRFPDGTETRSAVPEVVAEGSTNDVAYEIRCPLKPDARPDLIRLNLVLKGDDAGNAFFKEMELWSLPTGQPHGRLARTAALPRKFDSARDESVTSAEARDATGWFFGVKPNQQTIRLFEVENPATDEAATLVLRGRFGTSAVKGAYLQIVCCFPDGTEAVSKEPELVAEGDTNPTAYEVRHPLKPGEKPYLIRVNVVLKKSDKEQSVFLKELELSQAPAAKK